MIIKTDGKRCGKIKVNTELNPTLRIRSNRGTNMNKRTPFHVHAYPGDLLGKFCNEHQALRVAAMWSKHYQSWTEVTFEVKNGGGLIGQFSKGELTPEFAHRQNDVWPHAAA